MSKLRSFAHLEEQLGEDLVAVLTDPSNTGKVRAFCEQLLKDALPTEITVGGRTYELLGFLWGDEKSVSGLTMVERAKEMRAHLGQDEGQHLLDHQEEIPEALQGKVVFVFTDWRSDDLESVACSSWSGVHWVKHWLLLVRDRRGRDRLLRRK